MVLREDDQREILISQIMELQPLPTLDRAACKTGYILIEELIESFTNEDTRDSIAADDIRTLVLHLRSIGAPGAAESIASLVAHRFEQEGKNHNAALLLNQAASSCSDQHLFNIAEEYFLRAHRLIEKDDHMFFEPSILSNYAILLVERMRFDEALELLQRALGAIRSYDPSAYERKTGFPSNHVMGTVLNNLGWLFIRRARVEAEDDRLLPRAVEYLDEALQSDIHKRTEILAKSNLIIVRILHGDHDSAQREIDTLVAECRQHDLHRLLPEIYHRQAQIHAARQEVEPAIEWIREALRISLVHINPRQESRIIETFLGMLQSMVAQNVDPLSVLQGSGAPILQELLLLLRSKDTYTGGDHSRRVANLSKKIARAVAADDLKDESWVKYVTMAGLLHDVGKLMIPWSILNKLRSLTPREWSVIHSHTTYGEQILTQLNLPELGKVVGEHHERPDGTGYPRGIRKLSTAGAIVAVADAFEAMTSPSRLYSRRKKRRDALDEIKRGTGTQFHPEIVRALETVIRHSFSYPNA